MFLVQKGLRLYQVFSRVRFSKYTPFQERLCEVDFISQENLDHVRYPVSQRKLHPLPKQPNTASNVKNYKYALQNRDFRGPEICLEGGELKYGHLEMLRLTINRNMDENRMFAKWRIEAPWKPRTKRSQGSRMGGGKGEISYYSSPVKEGRIIVELCGNLDWREAHKILHNLAVKMPFPARFVSQSLLDFETGVDDYIYNHNVNPMAYKIRHLMNNNYAGCRNFISPWQLDWGSVTIKK